MNTATNVMSSNLVNDDDLRELSYLEQIKTSGGYACYKNPRGAQNPYRYVPQGSGAFEQKWSGGGYRNTRFFQSIGNFENWCRRGGYTFFY
jgi:hypothetical protein